MDEDIDALRMRLMSANFAVTEARQAQAAGDLERANRRLDDAISTLGSDYLLPTTIDESGQKLSLASYEQARGRLGTAVALKRGVAEARLAMFQERHLGL